MILDIAFQARINWFQIMEEVPVVVVGAGPAGLTVALSLAERKIQVGSVRLLTYRLLICKVNCS